MMNNLEIIEREISEIKGVITYADYVWDEENTKSYPTEELETLRFKFETLSKYINTVCDPQVLEKIANLEVAKELPKLTDEFLETVPEAS